MIDKDTSSFVLVVVLFFAVGVEESSAGITDEVVHRHSLSWKKVVILQGVFLRVIRCLGIPGVGLASLFGILAGCTKWSTSQFACCSMQALTLFGCTQGTKSEQPLNSLHSNMSK